MESLEQRLKEVEMYYVRHANSSVEPTMRSKECTMAVMHPSGHSDTQVATLGESDQACSSIGDQSERIQVLDINVGDTSDVIDLMDPRRGILWFVAVAETILLLDRSQPSLIRLNQRLTKGKVN